MISERTKVYAIIAGQGRKEYDRLTTTDTGDEVFCGTNISKEQKSSCAGQGDSMQLLVS